MIDKAMSVTSNEVKFLKHLDSLHSTQAGRPMPVLLHLSPTNKCQLNCSHCCFAGRDKHIELPFDKIKQALYDFVKIGIKAVELTGGGEPSLYSDIMRLTNVVTSLRLPLGINTNAMLADRVDWTAFRWVRVSLNVLDRPKLCDAFVAGLATIRKQAERVTACYIVSNGYDLANLESIIRFADDQHLVTRLAPDCIQKRSDIAKLLKHIQMNVGELVSKSQYAFISDFNVYTDERKDTKCWMHLLKPFLYADGWVYTCPSSELSIENKRRMQERFRVCRVECVNEYYHQVPEPFYHDCHYCKYAVQNELMSALMVEVEDEEFC